MYTALQRLRVRLATRLQMRRDRASVETVWEIEARELCEALDRWLADLEQEQKI